MASSETPSLGELQSCTGVGWVTFERAGGAAGGAAASSEQIPTLRCFGMRVSQAIPSPGRRTRDGAADANSSQAAAVARGRGQFVEVGDDTWGLFCAGQLSMIVPPPATSATPSAPSVEAVQASPSASSSSSWAQCRVRCAGLSLRLDTVVADSEGATETTPQPRELPQPIRSNADSSSDSAHAGEGPQSMFEETSRSLLRGAEAVAGRASAIVFSVRGAARETGTPQAFVSDTANASRRILIQSGKIAKRSGEQVQRLAMLPWTGLGGAGGVDGENDADEDE